MYRKLATVALILFAIVSLPACAKKPRPDQEAAAPAAVESAPASSAFTGSEARDAARVPAEVSFQMERIHFDFDSYTLSAEARQILAATGQYLLANPGVNIVIEGHCDERGSDEYNLALGERRARAAQNYLVSLGVAAERTRIISYGEERPLDPASNEAAWAKNRRAEFVR
ncbi:peptidoglycan-associated lipoprotein Pal [Geoalkalibacter sp.]|uniref:peptidoglycan-associated lipoprotein Pal n=1 Tax=Geoalkalibacter sp. TaxID=3041440 RepID=UPI00272E356D|nr:peptidoglycan-associated lipoprotein Pal [Geoalkalibacter sp.]